MNYTRLIRITIATACLLLVPLVVMQFTDEVSWGPVDFAIAAALLFGAGLVYELVSARMDNRSYRAAIGLAVIAALALIWVIIGVGFVGQAGDHADLLFIGVLVLGGIGAFVVRFRSAGMTRVLFVMTLCQAIVTVIALVAGLHKVSYTALEAFLVGNVILVAMWGGSAWLFRKAGRELRHVDTEARS